MEGLNPYVACDDEVKLDVGVSLPNSTNMGNHTVDSGAKGAEVKAKGTVASQKQDMDGTNKCLMSWADVVATSGIGVTTTWQPTPRLNSRSQSGFGAHEKQGIHSDSEVSETKEWTRVGKNRKNVVNINSKPEVDFSLERIRPESGDPSGHEEVAGAADHRYVPGLVQQRVGSGEVNAPSVVGGVEDEGESEPRRENLLLVVKIESLRAPHRRRVKIVVQRDRVVEHDQVAEMVLPSQYGQVAPSRRPDDGRSCVLGVLAVVNDVVEVKRQGFAGLMGAEVSGRCS
ncbi:hypothetical protein U1Q18_021188 [Sarracenia purpurea var. burkii]